MNGMGNITQALQSPSYVQVRRRIFRQLIESLIYEGLLAPQMEEAGGEISFRIEGQNEAGEPVFYSCHGQRRYTFGRIRLAGEPVFRHAGGTSSEADSLSRFLLEVRDQLGAEEPRIVSFIGELEQTLFKDTLAQHDRQVQGSPTSGRTYDDWEGEIMDGHPYHPSYKSRIGFDSRDHYRYSPEFKPDIRPVWVAVRKEEARFSISKQLSYEEFLAGELGADQMGSFCENIRENGQDPDQYLILPAHPWQWERIIPSAFQPAIREKRLLVLGEARDVYRPQQSIRTLANVTQPEKSYIKLSLSITNTSTGRVIAPHTTENAPAISDWLKELAEGDPFLREEARVILLGEVMGIAYDPPVLSGLVQSATYGTLSCIWRESLHPYLLPGEEAFPFNGLCTLDAAGRPRIEPWVRAFGAEEWLLRVLETSVLPVVHFLFAHGIALESHAQNMVLIHRGGMPARVALKDFHDGIRFSRADLAEPGKCPDLLATPEYHARVNRNSFIETDDLEAVRDFMHDAFFFINIGELALFMADHFGIDERRFWSMARAVIEGHQQRFPQFKERFRRFDLFAPAIQVEQLTKRRMFPDTELRVQGAGNPLCPMAEVGKGGR